MSRPVVFLRCRRCCALLCCRCWARWTRRRRLPPRGIRRRRAPVAHAIAPHPRAAPPSRPQGLQPEALCAQRGLCGGGGRHPGRPAQDFHRVPGTLVHRGCAHVWRSKGGWLAAGAAHRAGTPPAAAWRSCRRRRRAALLVTASPAPPPPTHTPHHQSSPASCSTRSWAAASRTPTPAWPRSSRCWPATRPATPASSTRLCLVRRGWQRRGWRGVPAAARPLPACTHPAPTLAPVPRPPPPPRRRLQPRARPGLPHQEPHLHLLQAQVHHLRHLPVREDWLLALHLHLPVCPLQSFIVCIACWGSRGNCARRASPSPPACQRPAPAPAAAAAAATCSATPTTSSTPCLSTLRTGARWAGAQAGARMCSCACV